MENLSIYGSPKILFIEPFYGGSHKELIDNLAQCFSENGIEYSLVTLSPKKWHWRARCSALILCDKIPKVSTETVLFCSSVLNLAELLGLRPDLCKLRKIVYFHENQLTYPVQHIKCRDVQYSYNELITCLAADQVLFNSDFNRMSFLENINKIIKFFPDNRPKGIKEKIKAKSKVLYFPVKFPRDLKINWECKLQKQILHIVWPHRWEFDKGPENFIDLMMKLKQNKCLFQLSILGQTYTDVLETFNKAREELSDEIINFGYLESKREYFEVLNSGHVVLSTAKHEFFGVSVLEATYCGCLPLLPTDLVYPEIYPSQCLYKNLEELYEMLCTFCMKPRAAVELRSRLNFDFEKYSIENLIPQYIDIMKING